MSLPPAAVWGIIGVLVVIIGVVMWAGIFKEPSGVDPKSIPPEQMLDPDPPRTRDYSKPTTGTTG